MTEPVHNPNPGEGIGGSQISDAEEKKKGALARIKDSLKAVLSKIKTGMTTLTNKIKSSFHNRKPSVEVPKTMTRELDSDRKPDEVDEEARNLELRLVLYQALDLQDASDYPEPKAGRRKVLGPVLAFGSHDHADAGSIVFGADHHQLYIVDEKDKNENNELGTPNAKKLSHSTDESKLDFGDNNEEGTALYIKTTKLTNIKKLLDNNRAHSE